MYVWVTRGKRNIAVLVETRDLPTRSIWNKRSAVWELVGRTKRDTSQQLKGRCMRGVGKARQMKGEQAGW